MVHLPTLTLATGYSITNTFMSSIVESVEHLPTLTLATGFNTNTFASSIVASVEHLPTLTLATGFNTNTFASSIVASVEQLPECLRGRSVIRLQLWPHTPAAGHNLSFIITIVIMTLG